VGNETVDINVDIKQWIMELGGGYRVTPEFSVLLAGRYYSLDTGATSESIAGSKTGEAKQSWGDLYIGARYLTTFKDRWIFGVRGDVGAGGSDLALFGEVDFGYRFSDLVSAVLAWRVLSLDRQPNPDDGNYFKYEMVQNGPGIGVVFSF
jgi:hypothetical protein